ncbi:MAG: HAMP domain-containing sensor histidine kinase [Litoreibacter sp.]|nr:HAMP domain-containing sensor histidine kinase [Litoreibacter sp.]
MATAVFIAIAIGSDVFERRIDTTLETLARTSDLGGARGDTFGVILRRPDDINDLPRPFARVIARGGGTVVLDRDYRQSEAWRVLVDRDSKGAPIMAALPLEDAEDAFDLLGGILWITVLTMIALTLMVGLVTGILAQRRMKRINGTLTALASGDLTARTGIARNRDDLDDMARQVDVTASELERLVAQTRNLSASLAHDLRTPLARLRSRLETLPEGEERGAALEEAERLSSIFDTIMRVARIEAAQGTDGFEPVALGELMRDLAETFGPVVEDEGKTLNLNIDGNDTVMADRQMLVQATANLIQNAMRYGGDQIALSARAGAISVADNGPGVDPDQYAEIVKPMVRLDTTRQSDGTGLGLALVRAVADRHNAQLILSQTDPHGLTVTLKFADL